MPAEKTHTGNNVNRRTFLGLSLKWATGLLSLLLTYPLFRFLGFTVKAKPRYITVPTPLPLSGYHAGRDFILFANPGTPPYAVSRTCTHLGCRVNFLEDKQLIECPCHQSRFTAAGILISGPAKKNLPLYAVETKETPEGVVSGYVVTL
jgi:cytochrome b6-f complex iron-sulfur subunit